MYVLLWTEGGKQTPFYVGQTTSIWQRLNDYYWAQWEASTDFKVGETVKYLHELNLKIFAKYKASDNRWQEEKELIHGFRTCKVLLLNDLAGYDYRTANEQQERIKIRKFIDRIVTPAAGPTKP